jgi:hypothetical protein
MRSTVRLGKRRTNQLFDQLRFLLIKDICSSLIIRFCDHTVRSVIIHTTEKSFNDYIRIVCEKFSFC